MIKKYTKPEIKIEIIDLSDIIVTSDEGTTQGDYECDRVMSEEDE